ASLVHQIEFDVAAAPIKLELAFTIAVRCVLASRDDGQIRGQKVIAHAAQVREAAFEAPLVQIVEEESADAAGFVAMLEEEIAIAPILVPRIRVIAERCARVASGAMPVQHVFFERVVRGEVETAAEP